MTAKTIGSTAHERIYFGRMLRERRGDFPRRGGKESGWTAYLASLGFTGTTAYRYMKYAECVENGTRHDGDRERPGPAKPRSYTPVRGVYFVQGVGGGPIKIGESSDVDARVRDLQASSPVVLRLLGVIVISRGPAARQGTERAWHLRFAEHRLHGEWFSPAPDLVDGIRRAVLGEEGYV